MLNLHVFLLVFHGFCLPPPPGKLGNSTLQRRHVDRPAVASAVGCGHGRPRAAKFAQPVPGGGQGEMEFLILA